MSTPTPLEMAYYYSDLVGSEESDLNASLYELDRALVSRWPDDLPRAVRELQPILNSYIGLTRSLVRNLNEAAQESEKSHPKQLPY